MKHRVRITFETTAEKVGDTYFFDMERREAVYPSRYVNVCLDESYVEIIGEEEPKQTGVYELTHMSGAITTAMRTTTCWLKFGSAESWTWKELSSSSKIIETKKLT